MSATQLEDPQSLNLYAYCTNDPINQIDPSGLFGQPDSGGGGSNAGGIIGVILAVLGALRVIFGGRAKVPTGLVGQSGQTLAQIETGERGAWTQPTLQTGVGAIKYFILFTPKPAWLRKFYEKYQAKLNICLGTIFKQLLLEYKKKLDYQNIDNSPDVDTSRTQRQLAKDYNRRNPTSPRQRKLAGLSSPGDGSIGKYGKISIARNNRGSVFSDSTQATKITAEELNERTYAHELGNVLSRRI